MEKVDPQRRRVVKIKYLLSKGKKKPVFFYVHITLSFHNIILNSHGYVFKSISLLKNHLLENNIVIIS